MMKGLVFTEFIEFIEDSFGFETVDVMIANAGVSGVYTQAGNYPFEEMLALLVALSKETNTEIATLLEVYGRHLFEKLAAIYPYIDRFTSTFDIVEHIDNIIHPEVHKLYPEAELPSFVTLEHTQEKIVMEYHSSKSLEHFAKGLILGAAAYYGESIEVNILDTFSPARIEVKKI
jgi:hypothetical protein